MSSSSTQINTSFSNFPSLFDAALREYHGKTGKDIETDPLTARLLHCDSSDAVLDILQEQAHAFDQYRNGDWKVQLMRRLKPTVDILLGLSTSGVFGEGIGLVRLTKSMYRILFRTFIHDPAEGSTSKSDICRCWSSTCSVYLIWLAWICSPDIQTFQAAKGVSDSYDALTSLFECFEHYLTRLKVFTEIPSSVGGILVKIMAELLAVLALATQQIKQGRVGEFMLANSKPCLTQHHAVKFAKKLLGENDIEVVLQRLDRLTVEESRMTAAQTMEVVYGLFNNVKVVMEGTETLLPCLRSPSQYAEYLPFRWKDVNNIDG